MGAVGDSGNVGGAETFSSKIRANAQVFLEKINKSIEAIKVFDANGDGTVTIDELSEALNKGGQWGAFDEVNFEVGNDMDKNKERLRQDGATATKTYSKNRNGLYVNGAKVINESTNDDGVSIAYTDHYDANGDLSSVEQKVSKKANGKEHTVVTEKRSKTTSHRETVISDSQSYTSSHSETVDGKRGSNSDDRITFTKGGNTVEFSAFEFKNPDGTVRWAGTKLYVNGENLLADNN